MIAKVGKRSIAFLLAVLMLISVAPVQAFATEGEHDHEHECAHEYVDEVTAPGCETPGFTTWTCTLCGDSYVTDEVDALCHNFEAGTPVAATPEAQGYTPYVCTLCGREEKADLVDYVAPETEPVVVETTTEEPEVEKPVVDKESGESEALVALRAEIAAYIEQLGITPDMPDQLLLYAYGNHESYEAAQASLNKQDEFIQKGLLLSEEEQNILLAEVNTKLCLRYREVAENAYDAVVIKDASYTVNNIKVSNTGGSLTNSNNTITATVSGSDGTCNMGASSSSMTITVTNSSEKAATVAFNWAATNVNSLVIDGATSTAESGSVSKLLDANEVITISITTGVNGTENKLVMSDFSYTEAKTASNVTFAFNSSLGSVTVGGTAITSGYAQDVSLDTGVALVAAPASGVTFLGWIDAADRKILSTAASYTLKVQDDTTVQAVFTKNDACFLVDGNHLYESLPAALEAVVESNDKTIVLANNGTLAAGEYIIPTGVTLLIPYNAANTLYTTNFQDACVQTESYSVPTTVYRTLTMADGAHITIEGAMSLSAQMSASQPYHGAAYGPMSRVAMNSGSTITVKSGGTLYTYGHITGSGAVTIKNGGTVYEVFQLTDYRGGDVTSQMIDNAKKVLPMSQYYVQNVEVPMTLEAGAAEMCVVGIFVTALGIQSSDIPFIGTVDGESGMFHIESGSLTKDYIESEDRVKFTLNGNVSMQSLSLKMNLGVLIGTKTINSANYNLPINSNITVDVQSGSIEVTQNIAMLPGSEFIIREGVTCTLGSGKQIYVYDRDQWGGYSSQYNSTFRPSLYAPGRTYNRKDADLVDAKIQIDGIVDAKNGDVYTTTGGANIFSTGTGKATVRAGTETKTYQVTQNNTSIAGWPEIPITSAKLKNADGSYTSTNIVAGESRPFKYENGTWRMECDGTNHVLGDNAEYKAATCTEAGYLRGTCVDCGTVVNETYDALGHTEVVDAAVAPTCETDGLTEGKHCSVCSAVIVAQEVDPKLGHKWNDGSITQQPTCTVDGVRTYTCQNDNSHEKTEAIPAKGHDMKEQSPVPATCTEGGYTPRYCANNCGLTEKNYTSEPLDHDWNITYSATDITKVGQLIATRTCQRTGCGLKGEATATVQKVDTVEATCNVKGEITYTADFEADWAKDKTVTVETDTNPDNHKNVTILEAVAPTCETDGLTEGKHCNICNTDFVAQEVDPKLGHDWGEVTYTWNNNYYSCTATRACQRTGCGETETLTQVADKKVSREANCVDTEIGTASVSFPEAYKDWAKDQSYAYEGSTDTTNHKTVVQYKAVESTCTEYGHEAGERCDACGENISGGAQYTTLRPHNYKSVVTAPTCTEAGYTTYTCSYNGCQDSYTSDEVAPLGHTPGEAVVENNVDPDCTTPGSYDSVVYCTVETCKAQISREKVTVDALGHTKEVIPAVDPTCTETGLTAGVKCSVCDDVITAQEVVDALDHNIVIDKAVAPTCTETGLTQGQHCSRCDDVTVAQEVVEATGHSYDEGEVTTPATCETAGEMTFTCQNNGCTDSYTQSITALGHIEVVHDGQNPTCTEIGWNQYVTCDRDGCNYSTYQERAALGHAEDSTPVKKNAVAPTCTVPGSYDNVYYCWRCGTEEMRRVTVTVDALNHDVQYHDGKEATCTEDGYEPYETCSRCDHTTYKTIKATGHSYDAVVTEPTCTADGYTTYTCSVCKNSYTGDTVAASGHSYEAVVTDPTCTEAGYTTHTCSVCTDSYTDSEVAALNHAYEAEVTKEATCTEPGVKTYTCKNDETHTYTEEISATNHERTTVTIEGKKATCTEPGLTEGKKCTACGEVLVEQEVIEATGHTYENGVCTGCGESELTVSQAMEGITYQVAGRVVTVTYSIPCKVGYLKENAYVAISAVANEDGSYSFTAPEGVKEVVIVVKGDINGDGKIRLADSTRTKALFNGKVEVDAEFVFAADVSGDGTIKLADSTQIKAVYNGKRSFSW